MKPGDRVLYVAHACHWNETDTRGEPLFNFVHAVKGPPVRGGQAAIEAGAPVADLRSLGIVQGHEEGGVLTLASGHKVRIEKPRRPWPATVVELEGLLWLEIKHPNGAVTLHYPLGGPVAVQHDPTGKGLHTWHRARAEKTRSLEVAPSASEEGESSSPNEQGRGRSEIPCKEGE